MSYNTLNHNDLLTTLSKETILFYTEQLNTTSPWFILNPNNTKIILCSNNFYELFECECDHHDLSLNQLPITQDSYNELINEVNYTVKSNQFASSLIALEMQCNKTIPLWLSLQPIMLNDTQAGILVYTQPADTPEYMAQLLKTHQLYNATTSGTIASDSGVSSHHQLQLRHFASLPIMTNDSSCSICNHKFDDIQQIILNLVLAGFSQREIGEKLKLSRTRIAQHLVHICNKHGIAGGSSKLLKKHLNSHIHAHGNMAKTIGYVIATTSFN